MSKDTKQDPEQSLVPVAQRVVDFYGDEIQGVVITTTPAVSDVFVPVRPLCNYLGVDWSAQRQRIGRDPVLSEALVSIAIDTAGGPQDMLCLPLDYLNGWLFGINAGRVKEEHREKVIQYQRECYRILADAFIERTVPGEGSTLVHIRELGRAIMQMAEEQIEFDRRLSVTEGRLDKAATVVGDLTRRVYTLEKRVAPGNPVTVEQAMQISQGVKAVAIALGKETKKSEFGAVYGELYRKFGITSYKQLPADRFDEALTFLTDWYRSLTNTDDIPF